MSSTQSSLVNLAPIFYMSPELLKANEIDEKSDVYSFGLVAYSILTNKTPARDFEKPEVFEPVFGEDVVEAYRDLIRRCTMKDPSERPEFSEIVKSLENAEKFVKEIDDIQEYKDCIESVKSSIVGPNKD